MLNIKIKNISVEVTVEIQRKAWASLTGDSVTDCYVRNYLFEFGSRPWQ